MSITRILTALLALLAAFAVPAFAAGEAEAPDPGADTRTIEHAMGTTEVPANPERVVLLTNEGTEALLALGVKPVGAVRSWLGSPWYDHISDRMEGVTVVGTETSVNLETVLETDPDLIIGNTVRQEEIYDKLAAIAPTVFSERLQGSWQANFRLYAKTLGMQEKAERMLAEYEQQVSDLRADLKEAGKLDTTISIVRFIQGGRVRMYYKDSFSGAILEDIGLERPASQDKDDFAERVTKERIPEMDADYLFYFTYDTGEGDGRAVEEEWTSHQLWQNLDVVQEGNAYRVSDAIWNTSGGIIAAKTTVEQLRNYLLGSGSGE